MNKFMFLLRFDEVKVSTLKSGEDGLEEKQPKESKKKGSKKNLSVKIKLPIDTIPKLAPRKERSLQKCCLVLFLLTLFIIATGILIYFFGK